MEHGKKFVLRPWREGEHEDLPFLGVAQGGQEERFGWPVCQGSGLSLGVNLEAHWPAPDRTSAWQSGAHVTPCNLKTRIASSPSAAQPLTKRMWTSLGTRVLCSVRVASDKGCWEPKDD